MAVAPGPLPTTMSTRKSSIAMYSNSCAVREVRWISSRNSTSPGCRLVSSAARSPACCRAGPLVIRNGACISVAMMPASVVFPSPGGPDNRTWSAGRPRRREAVRTRSSWSRTRGCPTNSLSSCGRRAESTAASPCSVRGLTSRSVRSGSLMCASTPEEPPSGPQRHRRRGPPAWPRSPQQLPPRAGTSPDRPVP